MFWWARKVFKNGAGPSTAGGLILCLVRCLPTAPAMLPTWFNISSVMPPDAGCVFVFLGYCVPFVRVRGRLPEQQRVTRE